MNSNTEIRIYAEDTMEDLFNIITKWSLDGLKEVLISNTDLGLMVEEIDDTEPENSPIIQTEETAKAIEIASKLRMTKNPLGEKILLSDLILVKNHLTKVYNLPW